MRARPATVTHTSTLADRSIQRNKSTNHMIQPGRRDEDAVTSSDRSQPSVLIVRSGVRLGSALTRSSARATSASVGASARVVAGCAAARAPNASVTSTRAAARVRTRISVDEGTAEFLLDVPGLEL